MAGSLWVGYLLVRTLQFCREQSVAVNFFSCFMRLPTEIIKHVGDAACVSVSIGHKSCRSSLDHFNLVFSVSMVWGPDSRTVVQIRPNHGEVSLVSSLACRRLRRRKPSILNF